MICLAIGDPTGIGTPCCLGRLLDPNWTTAPPIMVHTGVQLLGVATIASKAFALSLGA